MHGLPESIPAVFAIITIFMSSNSMQLLIYFSFIDLLI